MLTTTKGIVLKTQKYADADSIITYLTPYKGIIKAFAKSPRKTKSRFGSSLEPLTHSKITFLGKEHAMPKIIQSDIIKSFHGLRENFQDFINISKLIEILISLTPEGAPNKKIFLFFFNIMTLIESLEEKHKDVLYLIAQIHLLALLGYAPRLSGCGKCGLNNSGQNRSQFHGQGCCYKAAGIHF
ncbi:MAG: DNA repair protein RecO [Nitrospirae bacterium]|nr:DNA repair protein RecO [Nitrospirota bacterium]